MARAWFVGHDVVVVVVVVVVIVVVVVPESRSNSNERDFGTTGQQTSNIKSRGRPHLVVVGKRENGTVKGRESILPLRNWKFCK